MYLFVLVAICSCFKYEMIPNTGNPPDKFYIPGAVLDSQLDRIIYFGMKNVVKDSYDNTLYTFDLISLTWDTIIPESEFIPKPLGNSFLYLRSDRILLSILGCDDEGYIGDVYAFNLTSNTWSTLNVSHIPGRCFYAGTSFVHDDQELIAFYGGHTRNGVSNELYLFNVWETEFFLLPNNGYAVYAGAFLSLAYFERKLYLNGVGGEDVLKITDEFFYAFKIYDLDKLEWTLNYSANTNKTLGLMGHNLIVVNSTLYLIGGYYGQGYGNLDIYKVNLEDFSTSLITKPSDSWVVRAFTPIIQYNDSLIISGGRAEIENKNEVIQFYLSPFSYRILSQEAATPQSRKNSIMASHSTYIYMFGGSSKDSYFNDLWRFSITDSKWESIKPGGSIPSPRENVYFIEYMDLGLSLFGGKGSQIYADFYFYTYESNYWDKPNYTGELPGPRHSGCFVLWNTYIILIGGFIESEITDEIYVFDVFTFTCHKVIWKSSETAKIANQVCSSFEATAESVKVDIVTGESKLLFQNFKRYKVQIWIEKGNFYSRIIKSTLFTDVAVSGSQSLAFNMTTVMFFGSQWSLYFMNKIVKISQETDSYYMLSTPLYVTGHSLVHYNRSVYIFGGCITNSILYFKSCYSNKLYKLDFEESDNITLPCSQGMVPPYCEFCPVGYHLDSTENCVPCSPGKYSNKLGATSVLTCVPCDYGTFSYNSGSTKCKYCPGGSTCYIGTSEPIYSTESITDSSIQPKIFVRNYRDSSVFTIYTATGMMGSIILVFLLSRKSRIFVIKADLFTSQHSNELNKPIIFRKKSIGGLFSLMFIAYCVAVIPPMIDSYIKDNIVEQKALVPLVTIDQTISSSFLTVIINLHYYGGNCIDSNTCISSIIISDESLKYSSKKTTCTKSSNTCSIKILYENCEIIDSGSISILSYEFESYCSIISVNVTSESSIPGEISSVYLKLEPESNNKVFKGSIPSVFSFEMTPSIFKSESPEWKNNLTGYHVSKYGAATIGSTVEQRFIIINPLLSLNVRLYRSNSALVTERKLIYSWSLFSSSVLGSVFGAMGMFGFVMKLCETVLEYYGKKKESAKKIEALKQVADVLGVNFDKAKNDATEISFGDIVIDFSEKGSKDEY